MSVTFRQYAYKNFIKHTKLTDLSCIEWGGDIHVPYDNPEKAADVKNEMTANNLITASYGSYYKLGQNNNSDVFSMILQTAKIISAPIIRVWGGIKNSQNLTAQEREDIIQDTLNIAQTAQNENITGTPVRISLEYHGGTITNTADSAVDFMKEVRNRDGNNVYLYWQPNQYVNFSENKLNLMKICPYLSNIHVFAWDNEARLPLSEYKNIWREYINIIKNCTSPDSRHDFLLEFVKDDSVEQFADDAKILIELLENI